MKRFALAILIVVGLGASVFAILNRPGAEASPDATITVNSVADNNLRDGVLTLREAMLLATGDLAVGALDSGECGQVSNSTYGPPCSTTDTIGAASSDTIEFASFGPVVLITLGSDLPPLDEGDDTIDASCSSTRWVVDGEDTPCFEITSDNNTIKGLEIYDCQTGVHITDGAQNNTIGGSNPGEGNVISGNDGPGVLIEGANTDGNVVKGNYIGTDPSGTIAVPNLYGIRIENGAQDNTIGGSGPGEGNVISGNTWSGVEISGAGTDGNVVMGNYIGTDASGTIAVPSHGLGVLISDGAQDNTIGGSGPGEGNVISGNDFENVAIGNAGTDNNVVKGNYIGTDASGTAALLNPVSTSAGVWIGAGAQNNIVGGTAPGEGNIIAFTGDWAGVLVNALLGNSTGNTIRGNSIHSNEGKGIWNMDGGNTELAPPTVESVGSVFGTACPGCTIDVYSDEEDEGRIYEGSTTADGDGNWSLSGTPEGPNITATATDSDGNTSEFSEPLEPPWPAPSPTPEGDSDGDTVPDDVEEAFGSDPDDPDSTPEALGFDPDTCTDGVDNDGDGLMDAEDEGCRATRTLVWGPGWHNVTWTGASTPEEAFACAAGNYAAAYRLVGGGWERYFPDRPDLSNMTDLAQYDAFLILVTGNVTCTMPVSGSLGTERTLDWGVGWQNGGWTGADGTAAQDAFACADGSYAAAYRLVGGGWERYFPDRPSISNMGPLNRYDAFLILVTAPVSCTMAIAP